MPVENVNAQVDAVIEAGVLRRLLAFYVHEHNMALPHSAFRDRLRTEMCFSTANAVPAELTSRLAAARRVFSFDAYRSLHGWGREEFSWYLKRGPSRV